MAPLTILPWSITRSLTAPRSTRVDDPQGRLAEVQQIVEGRIDRGLAAGRFECSHDANPSLA
jgi:hypothetical protein